MNPGPAQTTDYPMTPGAMGDQALISIDASPFREGTWSNPSLPLTGDLPALVGDIVMKYWSHNVPIDPNTGNFLPRDDAGPCSIMVYTEGLGVLASSIVWYVSTFGQGGTKPLLSSWTQMARFDFTTGLWTFGSANPLLATSVALQNNAAAATATLTNSPTAGNPTKWIPINDNGTIRNIPAW